MTAVICARFSRGARQLRSRADARAVHGANVSARVTRAIQACSTIETTRGVAPTTTLCAITTAERARCLVARCRGALLGGAGETRIAWQVGVGGAAAMTANAHVGASAQGRHAIIAAISTVLRARLEIDAIKAVVVGTQSATVTTRGRHIGAAPVNACLAIVTAAVTFTAIRE